MRYVCVVCKCHLILCTTEAVGLFSDIVHYIVSNHFYLIDVTGRHTTWGIWAPELLNVNRSYSDERGINSMQMLAFIEAAVKYTGDPQGVLTRAYSELANSTNQVCKRVCVCPYVCVFTYVCVFPYVWFPFACVFTYVCVFACISSSSL